MLSGVAISFNVQTSFGSVVVTEVDFVDASDANIHSTLQRPVYATSAHPLPGVVVIHGSFQNKEWVMSFGIELSRRGFVVLTIDANGHGNSDPGRGAGTAAVEYLADLDYVDESEIGLIGHSMGGGYSWNAINESTVTIDALVLVGSWIGNTSLYPYIPNTLIAVGDFDSISSYPRNTTILEPYFNVTSVEPGVTYGSFEDGSARRLATSKTNHLFETIDTVIVSETIEWMKNSLKNGAEDSYWLPSSNLLYPLWLVGGFLSILGILLTIFPLILILLDLSVFKEIKDEPSNSHYSTSKSFVGYGVIYAVIGIGTFFPFLAVGTILDIFIPFPQSYGLPVMSWILGSALLSVLTLWIISRFRKNAGLNLHKLAHLRSENGYPLRDVLRMFAMGLIVIAWMYLWTLAVDVGLSMDLRCFLPGFHDLTLLQVLQVPLYFIVFFIYFTVEGMWLTGPLQTKPEETLNSTMVNRTMKTTSMKTVPYLILVFVEFGGGYLAGRAVIPGMIGYSFMFFYAFIPWFAVATVVTMFAYRHTGNYYLGAILNAMMTGWILASILSIRA